MDERKIIINWLNDFAEECTDWDACAGCPFGTLCDKFTDGRSAPKIIADMLQEGRKNESD